ncbi:hypothetical protein M434DRAFT_17355 [Hypoxylon sp. CO27-5]|nr:hypothetical protein M434DRAFT_17355 [Hypoxylon sp. CO27-5]
MSYSSLKPVINAFDGAIIVWEVANSQRSFCFDVTFRLEHPQLIRLGAEKPPLHFHPYQEEYVEVLDGRLVLEVEGIESVLTKNDGEVCIHPWASHRLYPPSLELDNIGGLPDAPSTRGVTRFLLSGQRTSEAFRLDTVFFQNWYGYQDEIFSQGGKFDIIQVMNMFDAGGSYASLPEWFPFGKRIAQCAGIVIGRWLGGLLGYQPFHRRWTRDWQLACQKMETSFFLRRFADPDKSE